MNGPKNRLCQQLAEPMNAPRPIEEPSLSARAGELLGHLNSLEQEVAFLQTALFSPPIKPDVEATGSSAIEDMIANACWRVASLVGQVRTINQRLGAV